MKTIEMIKEMIPNPQPDVINRDIECAAFASMKDYFLDIEIEGCLFHLPQHLLKQKKRMSLMGSYN